MLSEASHAEIQAHLKKYPIRRSAIIPALYVAQREHGYLSEDALREVALILELDPTEVRAVAGFYTLFYKQPVGRHVIHFCDDLPCALRGADEFLQKLCAKLGVEPHGTTADGVFTVEPAMCLAACDRAPVMQIDLDYYENLREEQLDAVLDGFRAGVVRTDPAAVIKSERD